MAKNIVVCLDGTRNEPERSSTNVVRLYEIASKSPSQVAYYDPGVGTMGARSATTRLGKGLTRVSGLIMGHGVHENIEEAYRFLMDTYRRDDRIFVFGFSRGAYTARALVGMLRNVGLLRSGSENLIPYAMKLYVKGGPESPSSHDESAFWSKRSDFAATFGNPEFPVRFAPQVAFLGLWDTVKTIGWFNWRGQFRQARWPFTRKVPNVIRGRHAIAIDEKRRAYGHYRFDPHEVAAGDRLREMWFAGVHSDVGGTFTDDHKLADISFKWIADEAIKAHLEVDADMYEKHMGVPLGAALPDEHALGRVHTNSFGWVFLGPGWRKRRIGPSDEVHPSVHRKIELTAGTSRPYRPKLPTRPTT